MTEERPGLEITCQELVELITEYLEGELPPDVVRRFEDHLAICEGCDRYLMQMRETIRMLGHLPQASLSGQAREELMATFRTWKSSGRPSIAADNAES